MAGKVKFDNGFKRGVYETNYGNAAYISGPQAKSAKDLDSMEVIPLEMVTQKFLRKATASDSAAKADKFW